MRPVRLDIEGFASFREPTPVVFEGADLFVLTGPTGSGKSSIIDAITFALYGQVARYDSKQGLDQVISKGQLIAKVKLDFTIGETAYSIARSRGRGGHKVSFEKGESVLSAQVSEVERLIPEIIGLSFEEFTRCVVLPQGDFAELLHADAKSRQDLLGKLFISFDHYRKVRAKASQRATDAAGIAATNQALLEGVLRDATPEALAACRASLAGVELLSARFEEEQAALDLIAVEERELAARAETLAARATALSALKMPASAADLAAQVTAAETELAAAREASGHAQGLFASAAAALAALPPRAEVEQTIVAHESLLHLSSQIQAAEAAQRELEASTTAAATALDRARAAANDAIASEERLTRSDAAYHASRGLAQGDRCPICGETLAAAPSLAAPKGLKEAEAARQAADRAVRTAETAAQKASQDAATQRGRLDGLQSQHSALSATVATLPALAAAREDLAAIGAAEREHAGARAAAERERQRLSAAEAAITALAEAREKGTAAYHEARNPFAPEGAPAPSADLAASWAALLAWAAEALERGRTDSVALAEARAAGATRRETIIQAQRAACEAAGIAFAGRSPKDAALVARGTLGREAEQLEANLALRETAVHDRAEALRAQDLAGKLAGHFQQGGAGFENWFSSETLRDLCEVASSRLKELSGGAYSLTIDGGGSFEVIDHANADARRGVKTLSGGETFLASLCLALGLSEQVAQVSAQGVAHLESLFLDEGFGTLDPDTLDTVRGAIHELQAGGRMVGIITHVRELAEQVPIQFRVSKHGGTSRVDRVDL
jgi:exonuclease SbcC